MMHRSPRTGQSRSLQWPGACPGDSYCLAHLLLIQTWFPSHEQAALRASLDLQPGSIEEAQSVETARAAHEATGRDARFRIQVFVHDQFADCSRDGASLKHRHGRPLHLSRGARLRPEPQYLAWHRDRRFAG